MIDQSLIEQLKAASVEYVWGHYIPLGKAISIVSAQKPVDTIGDDIERVARAICVAQKLDPDRQWPKCKEWEAMQDSAKAAIAAMQPLQGKR